MTELTKNDFLTSVMRNGDMTMGSRLLFWELNQWIDSEVRVCFPTQKSLAENLGVSRASVIRWLSELRLRGLIEDVPRSYGNAYRVKTGPSPNSTS